MTKKALITGIAGQDGSYLTEYLLGLGYEVHGIVRRSSVAENQDSRLRHIRHRIKTYYGDLLDVPSLTRIMMEVMPDEIYNLGAMSHVRVSFDVPSFTIQTNALGVLNLLEIYRTVCPNAKFYQASSSEMFGNSVDEDGIQRLTTPMTPVSPYGCARLWDTT
jgi:GDPmannose 4,6-dehydratase